MFRLKRQHWRADLRKEAPDSAFFGVSRCEVIVCIPNCFSIACDFVSDFWVKRFWNIYTAYTADDVTDESQCTAPFRSTWNRLFYRWFAISHCAGLGTGAPARASMLLFSKLKNIFFYTLTQKIFFSWLKQNHWQWAMLPGVGVVLYCRYSRSVLEMSMCHLASCPNAQC